MTRFQPILLDSAIKVYAMDRAFDEQYGIFS